MNDEEAGRLLAMAVIADQRMPAPDKAGVVRGTWARLLHDVPFEAGLAAVTAWYRSERFAQTRESITTADIVQWWNARRRPSESERSGESAATRRALPAPEKDMGRLLAGVTLARSSLLVSQGVAPAAAEDEAAERHRVLSVACPYCRAAVGEACTGPRGPLTKAVAHSSRMELSAGKTVEVEPRSTTPPGGG